MKTHLPPPNPDEPFEPPRSDREFTGAIFKKFIKSPMVYGWKRGDKFLYIGATLKGFSRILSTGHPIGNLEEFEDDDQIILWYTTKENAFNLESQLIEYYKPKYNKTSADRRRSTFDMTTYIQLKRCPMCNERFKTRYRSQKHCKECLKKIHKQTDGSAFV